MWQIKMFTFLETVTDIYGWKNTNKTYVKYGYLVQQKSITYAQLSIEIIVCHLPQVYHIIFNKHM